MLRLICAFVLCLWAVDAPACDLCGCYTPQLETMHAREVGAMAGEDFLRGWYAGIAEQFTHFGTVQFNGREVANPAAQFLDSSVTQLVAGYSVTPHFAIQLNVPFIYREFRRPEAFRTNDGDIGGLGDASLLAKIVLWHHEWTPLREFDVNGKNPVAIDHDPDFTASLIGLLGVKFPTGATSRLKEEFHETQTPGAPESGIHGHDLTLGSGSYDAVFGGQTSLRYKSCFAEADAQFTWRSEGAHDYRFANDVSWSGGPGVYVGRRRDVVVGCQCAISGEHKDVDTFRDAPAEDTGVTSVFVGPRIIASRNHVSGEIAAEFPVLIDNTALQIVPDYRLRASVALSW